MRIQRLSWAGVKIELGTTTVLIDPLQDPSLLGGDLKEFVPIQTTTDRRYVLVTHLHNDHYDPTAARAHISKRGFVVCHRSAAATVASDGIRVRGVEQYDPIIIGDLAATAVEAVDGLGETQVSWVVSGGGRRVIHCGDTLWHGYWWKLRAQYGPFDVAFLPINGAVVQSRTPPSGLPACMTPEQASAAAQVLNVKTVCPMHYGGNEPGYAEVPDPEGTFKTAAWTRNLSVQLLKPGEWLRWPKD